MADYKHGFKPFDSNGDEYFYINEVGEDGSEKQVYKGLVSEGFKRSSHPDYAKVRREYIEKLFELKAR